VVALERVLSTGYELFSVLRPRAFIEPGARLTAGTTIGCNNYTLGHRHGQPRQDRRRPFLRHGLHHHFVPQTGSHLFVNTKTLVPVHKGRELPMQTGQTLAP